MINKKSKIFVAGHKGLVGSAIVRKLKKRGFSRILFAEKKNLNLLDQDKVFKFLKKKKPDLVIVAAARVGGIQANSNFKQIFIYENLQIQNNLIHGSYKNNIKRLIFLGSSCIYPKNSKQPIKEEYLLSGKLEETNLPYATAKIAGIKMCEAYNKQYKLNYLCLMPPNLYGPRDNYDLKNSHFFPALLSKIYTAKKYNRKNIILWGNGKSKRELLYSDDLARACEFFLKKNTKHTLINIGSGVEKTIKDFAKFIMRKMKVDLKIDFDLSKPNGTPRKKLNISLAQSYGWRPKIDLNEGFNYVFKDFLKNRIK